MKQPIRRGASGSKWALLVLFALLSCALALSACGGGSDSSATEASNSEEAATTESSQGGEQASGEPIVTWTYADVNTEGPQYKNIEETTRVYQEWVNEHGGIGGRPLEAHFCDARGTPTAAAACAREAVADEAVAAVGSFTFTGDAVTPILEKSKTAMFGYCCAVAPSEFSSPISLPIGSQPTFNVGLVPKAKEDGCKKISVVLIEGAESFIPLIDNAAKKSGANVERIVELPGTSQDYSPQVAEATQGDPDCLIMLVSEGPFIAWMPAFVQSGSEARMYGVQGNFNENVAKGFGEAVDGDVVSGSFPDIATPAWDGYREALKKFEADSAQDYNSLGGLGTWAAYEAFKQVVEGMKGPVDNETFLKAAETAQIDLPGMIPPLSMAANWGKTGGPEGFERLVNRCAEFSEFEGEKLVSASNEFTDESEIMGGTQPMDCGPPFKG
jgi:ABC-type branched-subunit amino acid transport system substrate-binding protein